MAKTLKIFIAEAKSHTPEEFAAAVRHGLENEEWVRDGLEDFHAERWNGREPDNRKPYTEKHFSASMKNFLSDEYKEKHGTALTNAVHTEVIKNKKGS